MAYSITTTSGSFVATVQDATINTTATSLTLIGRDYAGYGAFLNENFVHLMEHFAANTAPVRKLTGNQLVAVFHKLELLFQDHQVIYGLIPQTINYMLGVKMIQIGSLSDHLAP